jgi:hypothetical protein
MDILVAITLLIAVTVVPIMIGARVVGAKNTGFGSALIAVVVLSALSFFVSKYIGNPLLAFAASAAGGGVMLAAILGTTFWKGILVSIIAVAIQIGVLVMFAGALLGGDTIGA